MSYLTVDQLIDSLQKLKDSGIAGETSVMIPSVDNNGKSGYLKRIEAACRSSVAKVEFEKNWEQCKFVAKRGVEVVAIY